VHLALVEGAVLLSVIYRLQGWRRLIVGDISRRNILGMGSHDSDLCLVLLLGLGTLLVNILQGILHLLAHLLLIQI
jgi:hypothetical protein